MFVPGVTADARGIMLGKCGLMTFSTLEGAVSWLRLYSAEASLDELIGTRVAAPTAANPLATPPNQRSTPHGTNTGGLRIFKASTSLGSRDILLQIPAISSQTIDRAARLVRLLGGELYTGTQKHFVKYRDDRSPYGYDVVELSTFTADVDTIVYSNDFVQAYQHNGELPFDRLLFRLSLRRVPGGDKLTDADREDVMLVVERGLADGLIRYFWRNRVAARTGLFTPSSQSEFDASRMQRGYMLFAVRGLPQRMLDLFIGTPGIDVFRPKGPSCAVLVGYQHAFDLSSCSSVFPSSQYHLFWPDDRVDIVAGPLQLVDIADLSKMSLNLATIVQQPVGGQLDAVTPEPLTVNFRLVTATIPATKVVATLVPLHQQAWLKRLLFAMPPSLLRGQRIAVTEHGMLLLADQTLSKQAEALSSGVVPLGHPLKAIAPGLLVPADCDVLPRVSPDVLAKSLNHNQSLVTVLLKSGDAFRIADSALQPLERRSLAKLDVSTSTTDDLSADITTVPEVVNESVGRFALWGFPDIEDRKLLGAADDKEPR
jgi:hypothetical protein